MNKFLSLKKDIAYSYIKLLLVITQKKISDVNCPILHIKLKELGNSNILKLLYIINCMVQIIQKIFDKNICRSFIGRNK